MSGMANVLTPLPMTRCLILPLLVLPSLMAAGPGAALLGPLLVRRAGLGILWHPLAVHPLPPHLIASARHGLLIGRIASLLVNAAPLPVTTHLVARS